MNHRPTAPAGEILEGRTLSHYRIGSKLGSGGMGEVYRARDTRLGREVALKFLPPETGDLRRRRFRKEAQAVAALQHPNIVTIHSVEKADGLVFLVMELVEGELLEKAIPTGGFPWPRFYEIALPLVEAVDYAHTRGIVHRDLKPSNVMLDGSGHPKVLDFGLAKLTEPVGGDATLADPESHTEKGVLLGTAGYMSPEQSRGEPVDARSDIFSLGVLLFRMAAGRLPFSGNTPAEVISSILRDPPLSLSALNPSLPRDLGRILERCLAKDPRERWRGAGEIAASLRAIHEGKRVGGRSATASIAVLPFVDMSSEKDQDFFCEGMAEEIINALTAIRDLHVVSRTSSFRFKGTDIDIRKLGMELNVETVLEGSVRKVGNRLRVTTQLINVADGYHLWSHRFDRRLEDVFAIQDEIAESVARTLRVMLTEAEKRALNRNPTDSVDAYEYYLRGRQTFQQFRRKSIEFAAVMFRRAIELDPEFAMAHAGLADCHSYLYMFWAATEENREKADAASRRAVELNPGMAEAHAARGTAVSLTKRYDEAGKEFETAIALNPQLFEAYYFYARGHYASGNLEEAVHWFERAAEARPEDYQCRTLRASALNGLGRKEDSRQAYREALDLIRIQLDLFPGDTRALYFGAISLGQLGENREQSREWARRALAMDPEEPQVLYNVACVHALLGEPDAAVECLSKVIAHGDWWKTWMENDPDLSSIHEDPRFRALLGQDPA